MVLDQYGRLKVSLNNNSSSGWPTTGKAMINNTEYDTVQAAATAAVTGDIIKVGQGTDSGGVILATANSLVGLSAVDTILTRSDDGQATLYIGTADDTTIKDVTIAATGAGAFSACVQTNQDNVVFDQVTIQKTSGAPTDSFGINVFGGSGAGTLIRNCKITVSSGTNKYGVYCDTAASNVVIEDGEINGTTADVYIGHASAVVELRGVALLGGVINATTGTLLGWAVDDKGRDCGKIIKNTSGATVNRGDVGYINKDGEFKTTTTLNTNANWHIVTAGGPNNGWIFARRTGNATINYTGAAPSAGDYLVTSTSAGLAQAQATMRPEIFAVCLAAGSGGTVEALLLTQTTPRDATLTLANNLYYGASMSDSDFTATINGAPVGATLVYNAPSGGSEDAIKPGLTTNLAKLVLHNTTRGTSALISDVNTGTNTITLTAAVPAGWANGDTITARSQTNTANPSGGAYFFDFEITSELDALARSTQLYIQASDTGGAGAQLYLHPYQSNVVQKQWILITQTIYSFSNGAVMPIINKRFCAAWDATGTGTFSVVTRLWKQDVASP